MHLIIPWKQAYIVPLFPQAGRAVSVSTAKSDPSPGLRMNPIQPMHCRGGPGLGFGGFGLHNAVRGSTEANPEPRMEMKPADTLAKPCCNSVVTFAFKNGESAGDCLLAMSHHVQSKEYVSPGLETDEQGRCSPFWGAITCSSLCVNKPTLNASTRMNTYIHM